MPPDRWLPRFSTGIIACMTDAASMQQLQFSWCKNDKKTMIFRFLNTDCLEYEYGFASQVWQLMRKTSCCSQVAICLPQVLQTLLKPPPSQLGHVYSPCASNPCVIANMAIISLPICRPQCVPQTTDMLQTGRVYEVIAHSSEARSAGWHTDCTVNIKLSIAQHMTTAAC